MRYCPDCKCIIPEGTDICATCKNTATELTDDAPVTVTGIKGSMVSMAETALKEAGIPCTFENTEGNIYNSLNIKVNAESEFKVLVPAEFYTRAFNVCESIGIVAPEDRLIPEDSQFCESSEKTYNEKFESANGMNRHSWQIGWTILFIVLACLVIWGVDAIAMFIKSLFIG